MNALFSQKKLLTQSQVKLFFFGFYSKSIHFWGFERSRSCIVIEITLATLSPKSTLITNKLILEPFINRERFFANIPQIRKWRARSRRPDDVTCLH